MAALDAGYDVRASGMTLDRFCGSGITTVNLAAASIMSGMEDLVIAGGTEMMSYTAASADRWRQSADAGLRQSSPAGPSSANAPGRLRRRHRHAGRHLPSGAVDELAAGQPAAAPTSGHPRGPVTSTASLVPVLRDDGSVALDREEFPRPQTTAGEPVAA